MEKGITAWFEDGKYQIFDTLEDFQDFVFYNKNHNSILRVAINFYSKDKYLGEVEYSFKEFLENYG